MGLIHVRFRELPSQRRPIAGEQMNAEIAGQLSQDNIRRLWRDT